MELARRNNGFRKVAKWIVGAVVVASASHGIVMAQEETPKIPEVPEEEQTKTEVPEVPEKETKMEVPAVPEGGDGDAGRSAESGSVAPPAEPVQQRSSPSAEKDWMSKGDFPKANIEDWMHDSFINSKGPVGIGRNVAENAAIRLAQREGNTYVPPEPSAKPKKAAEPKAAAAPAPEADSASADKQ